MRLASFLASFLLAAVLVGDNCDRPGDELSVHMPSTASSSMVLLKLNNGRVVAHVACSQNYRHDQAREFASVNVSW